MSKSATTASHASGRKRTTSAGLCGRHVGAWRDGVVSSVGEAWAFPYLAPALGALPDFAGAGVRVGAGSGRALNASHGSDQLGTTRAAIGMATEPTIASVHTRWRTA